MGWTRWVILGDGRSVSGRVDTKLSELSARMQSEELVRWFIDA